MKRSKILYSINVEDVQHVAEEELGRQLTNRDLEVVEREIGDRFDWYEAIADVLRRHLQQDAFGEG